MKHLFELSEMTPDNNANAIAHEYAEIAYKNFFGYASEDLETLEDFLTERHILFDAVGKPFIVLPYNV